MAEYSFVQIFLVLDKGCLLSVYEGTVLMNSKCGLLLYTEPDCILKLMISPCYDTVWAHYVTAMYT